MKKIALLTLLLTACTFADNPTAPTPVRKEGAVFLGVTPLGANPTCNTVGLDGRLAPITPGRYNSVPNGTYSSTECVAVGYEKSYGPAFRVNGDTVTTNVVLVKSPTTPPPLDSMAQIRVELEDGSTANVEMRERFPLSGPSVVTILNKPTPYRDSLKVDGSGLMYQIGKPGFATKRVKVEPIPRQVNIVLVSLTPLPTIVSDSGILNVYSSPKGMRARLYTALYGTLIATQTTNFDRKVKAGAYVVVCEDPTDKRMADTAYAVVPAGGFDNAVCDNPLKPEPPAPPPTPVTKGTLLVACNIATQAVVRTYGTNGVVVHQGTTNFERELEAGFYVVTYTAPAGYTSKPVTVAINASQRTVANCALEKEVAPPPPVVNGTLLVACNIATNARVMITSTDKFFGEGRTNFNLSVAPGTYTVAFTAPEGYTSKPVEPAVVTAGGTTRVDCRLEKKDEPVARTIIRVLSDPVGMEAKLERRVGEEWVLVKSDLTNFVVENATPGFHRLTCIQPTRSDYQDFMMEFEVPKGQTTEAVCKMKKKEGSS